MLKHSAIVHSIAINYSHVTSSFKYQDLNENAKLLRMETRTFGTETRIFANIAFLMMV